MMNGFWKVFSRQKGLRLAGFFLCFLTLNVWANPPLGLDPNHKLFAYVPFEKIERLHDLLDTALLCPISQDVPNLGDLTQEFVRCFSTEGAPLATTPARGFSGHVVFKATSPLENFFVKVFAKEHCFYEDLVSNFLIDSQEDPYKALVLFQMPRITHLALVYKNLGDTTLGQKLVDFHRGGGVSWDTFQTQLDGVITHLHSFQKPHTVLNFEHRRQVVAHFDILMATVLAGARLHQVEGVRWDRVEAYAQKVRVFLEQDNIRVGFTHGNLHFDNIVLNSGQKISFVDNSDVIHSFHPPHAVGLVDEELEYLFNHCPQFDVYAQNQSKGLYQVWHFKPTTAYLMEDLGARHPLYTGHTYRDPNAKNHFRFIDLLRNLVYSFDPYLYRAAALSPDLKPMRKQLKIRYCLEELEKLTGELGGG